MVSINEVYIIYHLLIGLESMNFLLPPSRYFSQSEFYFPPHFCKSEASSSSFVSHICDPSENYYLYLPILKQLNEGYHMQIGGLFDVEINNDHENPKIIYAGDVLIGSKKDQARAILIECHKLFDFNYDDMTILDPNLIVHNILIYPNTKPRKVNPTQYILIKDELKKIFKSHFI